MHWNKTHKERYEEGKRICRLRKLGITLEEYDRLYEEQEGGCAVCFGKCETGRRLAADHDHKTKKIRGLLCMRCNTFIGKADDDPTLLRLAAEYLEKGIQ